MPNAQMSSCNLNLRFGPKRNDEKPRRSNVRILCVPHSSAIRKWKRRCISQDARQISGCATLITKMKPLWFQYADHYAEEYSKQTAP